jgi:hypothetical protein
MKNARFWHFTRKCNWVKLTVRPDKQLKIHESYYNGEGNSWECDTYYLENGCLINEWAAGGNDSDGRHRSGGTLICKLENLKAEKHWEIKDFYLPKWEKEESWQRDYTAEAANY